MTRSSRESDPTGPARDSPFTVFLAAALAIIAPPPANAAATLTSMATALRDDGLRLLAGGNPAVACAKLMESQRLDPSVETLVDLASCHETVGRTATAWSEFRRAESWANREARFSQAKLARRRAAMLRPKLCSATILVPETARVPGLEIRLDGEPLGQAAWNTPTFLDPGVHELAISAPGHPRQSKAITILPDSTKISLAVELEPPPDGHSRNVERKADRNGDRDDDRDDDRDGDPGAARPVARPARDLAGRRTPVVAEAASGPAGLPAATDGGSGLNALGAVALAAIAAGTVTGILSYVRWRRYVGACKSGVCQTEGARADATAASRLATVSDVAFAAGLTAAAAAAVVYYRAQMADPTAEVARTGWFPAVSAGAVGIGWEGAW